MVAGDGGGRWWFVMKYDGGDNKVNDRGDRHARVRSATTWGGAMDGPRRKWREKRDER